MNGRDVFGKLAFGWSVLLLIGGCWGGYSSYDEELDALWAETHAMAADRSSTSDSECGAVAIGSKPCGGPTSYIIYSRATVEEAALLAKVERYTELDRFINNLRQYGSDCLYVDVPRAAISVEGLCVADWTSGPVVRETDLIYTLTECATGVSKSLRLTPDGLRYVTKAPAAEQFQDTIPDAYDERVNTLLAEWDTLPAISAESGCADGYTYSITYRGRTLSWSDGQEDVPAQLSSLATQVVYGAYHPYQLTPIWYY